MEQYKTRNHRVSDKFQSCEEIETCMNLNSTEKLQNEKVDN